QAAIVDRLAGPGLLVEQRHENHARLEIAAYEAADDAGAPDVLLQLLDALRRSVIGVRHHRTAAEPFLGDFRPPNRGRPKRLDPRSLHAGRQNQLVVYLLQHVEVARIEDVAIGVLDDDAQRVAEPAQLL